MVGMCRALVTAAAMGAGTHSSTRAKQPTFCNASAWSITRSASSATWACGLKPPGRAQCGAQGGECGAQGGECGAQGGECGAQGGEQPGYCCALSEPIVDGYVAAT